MFEELRVPSHRMIKAPCGLWPEWDRRYRGVGTLYLVPCTLYHCISRGASVDLRAEDDSMHVTTLYGRLDSTNPRRFDRSNIPAAKRRGPHSEIQWTCFVQNGSFYR